MSACHTAKPVLTTIPTPEPAIEPVEPEQKEDKFFVALFENQGGIIDSIRQHRKDWNVQIIYTEVNRSRNGIPSLKQHSYNNSDASYFYPASTVKFPISMLALERLNNLNIAGLNKNSSMITEAGYGSQTAVYNDPTAADGRPTIAQYIKKILLVSDNDAFNRLYEFLGQEYINQTLHSKGYEDVQIRHRLDVFLSEDENRHSNPVNFYDAQTRMIYSKPLQNNTTPFALRKDSMGSGYMRRGEVVHTPMDFSTKNRMALQDLHDILVGLVFPQAVHKKERFNLTDEDRMFMLRYMSSYPSESTFPSYDSSYNDAYVKFILHGAKQGKLPPHIRIFNKPGDAYGQLTDVAYVVDFENNIEFFVSATVYCNTDGILNDDRYDYNTIGLPFMQKLGELLYQHELKRNRTIAPDLTELQFTYDKN